MSETPAAATAPAGATPDAAPPPAQRWLQALGLVVVTRLVWLATAAGGALLDGRIPALGDWRRWDADLYLKIATGGYAGSDPWSEAFMPGLPLLLRGLGSVGMEPVVAGLLISAAASVVAVRWLLDLAQDHAARHLQEAHARDAGWHAGLLLLAFPTTVALVAPYTEALFLAGAIPAFHLARRGQWHRVGPFAALAAMTRVTGALVLLALAAELLVRQRDRWRAGGIAVLVGAVPLLAYLAWLWATRGSPWVLLVAQQEGWHRRLVGPVEALQTTWWAAWTDPSPALRLTWSLELVAAGVLIAVVVWALARREVLWFAYTLPLAAAVLSSTWYFSVPRILLTVVPLFLILATWTIRGPWRLPLTLTAMLPAAALGVVTFTSGGWWF